MTIEKAIEQLEDLKRDRESFAKTDEPNGIFAKDIKAIDIAVNALEENKKLKRLLKLAIESFDYIDEEEFSCAGCHKGWEKCPYNTGEKDCCTEKWKYHDEAMKLIGDEQ